MKLKNSISGEIVDNCRISVGGLDVFFNTDIDPFEPTTTIYFVDPNTELVKNIIKVSSSADCDVKILQRSSIEEVRYNGSENDRETFEEVV